MEEKDGFPKGLSAVIIGVCGGVIMALLVITGLRAEGYQLFTFSFWLIVLIAAILPSGLDFLSKKGILPIVAEPIMIGVSFALALLYGNAVASNETAAFLLRSGTLIVHGISALVLVIRILIEKMQERKENR